MGYWNNALIQLRKFPKLEARESYKLSQFFFLNAKKRAHIRVKRKQFDI